MQLSTLCVHVLLMILKSPEDCNLLETDVSFVHRSSFETSISKTEIISFSRKTNILIYYYKICKSSITRSDCVKDLGVFLDSEFVFP
jgi:hypothetical protein